MEFTLIDYISVVLMGVASLIVIFKKFIKWYL